MENNTNLNDSETLNQKLADNDFKDEEYTPKLFSEDQSHVRSEINEKFENNENEELFDQDTNEDEDFEIPAFLRRQKF